MLDIAGQEARIQYQGCSYGLDERVTCQVRRALFSVFFFAIVVLNLRTHHSLPSFCFLIGVNAKMSIVCRVCCRFVSCWDLVLRIGRTSRDAAKGVIPRPSNLGPGPEPKPGPELELAESETDPDAVDF